MRVLLLRDVYKLGRAGDVKKVADGYGRNYLIPQGLAVLATAGALKQAGRIGERAAGLRERLNEELGSLAEELAGLKLTFAVKAGETGKLYGSITTAMIAEAIEAATGVSIDRRQVDCQPVKLLGVHKARVRLTIDLVPEVTMIVHREGEPPESAFEEEEVVAPAEVEAEAFAELRAELEAEEEALEAESEVDQVATEGEAEEADEAPADPEAEQADISEEA